jgi:hypothetical protein
MNTTTSSSFQQKTEPKQKRKKLSNKSTSKQTAPNSHPNPTNNQVLKTSIRSSKKFILRLECFKFFINIIHPNTSLIKIFVSNLAIGGSRFVPERPLV